MILQELLKNLEEEQIENLRMAIASRGEHRTSCILHKEDNCDADLVESARVLAVRAFRWENIRLRVKIQKREFTVFRELC